MVNSFLLEAGDTVDLVAPASGFSFAEYESSINFVRKLGLVPRVAQYEELVKTGGIYSNSDDYRFNSLYTALCSDSRAVWCIGGGNGCHRLIEKLNEVAPPLRPKIFVGFSDITILLNYFIHKWGWQTCIHGVMLKQKLSDIAEKSIKDLLFNPDAKIEVTLRSLNESAINARGEIKGKFIGGCLSLMHVFIGTDMDLADKIILLEDDRFETPERVDRILGHMIRVGVFAKSKAIILGNFLEDESRFNEMKEVFGYFGNKLNEIGVPLLYTPSFGHGTNMISTPIGTVARIDLGTIPKVSFKL